MVYARVDERSQRQGISVLKLAWLRQRFTALVAAVFAAGCGAPEANEPALYTRLPVESAPAPGLRSVEAAKPSMRLVLDRSFAESARSQWRLPRALHEVSGIAVVGDRIFARADEEAVVFELDATGEHSLFMRLDAASHGGPVRDDFEGITALANDLFLVTSAGLLFRAPGALDPGAVQSGSRFDVFDTGLEDVCEVEGLDTLGDDELVIACKNVYGEQVQRLYVWQVSQESVRLLLEVPGVGNARPSAVMVLSDWFALLSAKNALIQVFARNREERGTIRLRQFAVKKPFRRFTQVLAGGRSYQLWFVGIG